MVLVVKLGGHLLNKDNTLRVQEYVDIFYNLIQNEPTHLVIGGGPIARLYIQEGRRLGLTEAHLDQLAIEVTWLNALLFQYALSMKNIYSKLTKTFSEMIDAINENKIIIAGGLMPGQSTTAVATLLAELTKSRLLIYATDVDGIYTKDPKKHSDAKLLKSITIDDLIHIMEEERAEAGTYKLFDPPSLKIIKRSKLTVRVINGTQPENIIRAAKGEDIGTLVTT
ncbi:MAG: UMP kinase [Thermoprotei archaeon]